MHQDQAVGPGNSPVGERVAARRKRRNSVDDANRDLENRERVAAGGEGGCEIKRGVKSDATRRGSSTERGIEMRQDES